MNKPEKMLVYLSYPIMDIDIEPPYTFPVIQNTPEHWVFYRPILPVMGHQPEIYDRLNYYIPKETKEKFSLTKQTQTLSTSEQTVLEIVKECEELCPPPTNSRALVLKDLAILSISDIIIVSCDQPSFGKPSIELLWANILGIHSLGVTDRFLVGPWLQLYTDVMVTTNSVFEELVFRGSIIDSSRKSLEKPTEEQNP